MRSLVTAKRDTKAAIHANKPVPSDGYAPTGSCLEKVLCNTERILNAGRVHNKRIPALNDANPNNLGNILRILIRTDINLSSLFFRAADENLISPLCSNEKPSSHRKATVRKIVIPGKLSARFKKPQSKTILLPEKEKNDPSKKAINGIVKEENTIFVRTMKVNDFEAILSKQRQISLTPILAIGNPPFTRAP